MKLIHLSWVMCLLACTSVYAQDTTHPEAASGTNINLERPVEIYRQALAYLLGKGQPKSAEKAATLFKLLAERNWASAQHMLGNLYYEGKGVEQNDLLAYKWLSLASRQNIRLAEALSVKRRSLQRRLPEQRIAEIEKWISGWKPMAQVNQGL